MDIPTRLLIAHTWDGDRLEDSRHGFVALERAGASWVIDMDAAFHDDPPPPGPAGALDELWNYEVVELFVASDGGVGGAGEVDDETVQYTEIELSPHGHHLILSFTGVRRRSARIDPVAVDCRIEGDRWRGRIELPHDALPPEPWRANAFAIHGPETARRYLAATPLPGPAPDFHQPGRFPRSSSGGE